MIRISKKSCCSRKFVGLRCGFFYSTSANHSFTQYMQTCRTKWQGQIHHAIWWVQHWLQANAFGGRGLFNACAFLLGIKDEWCVRVRRESGVRACTGIGAGRCACIRRGLGFTQIFTKNAHDHGRSMEHGAAHLARFILTLLFNIAAFSNTVC